MKNKKQKTNKSIPIALKQYASAQIGTKLGLFAKAKEAQIYSNGVVLLK